MGRWLCGTAVACVALVGCGDPERLSEADSSPPRTGDADALVVAAVEEVLGDGPFRSRTTGQIPFMGLMNGVYEQSGDEVFEVVSGDFGSATVIAEGTAYEWNSSSQSWSETPVDSFDPLVSPGFMYVLSLVGLLDPDDESFDSGSTEADRMPQVVTGWTEVEPSADGVRRFEREMPSTLFGDEPTAPPDTPEERLEEGAITTEFARLAAATSLVELDRDGNLVRAVVRVEFDGSEDYPDCAPLNRFVGTNELVVEYSDVGTEFEITVPGPAELVAEFPLLAEAPDFSDDLDISIDGDFRNENGERDLSGCPSP